MSAGEVWYSVIKQGVDDNKEGRYGGMYLTFCTLGGGFGKEEGGENRETKTNNKYGGHLNQ